MAAPTIVITGTYKDAAGDPESGTVTFTLNTPLHDAAGNLIVAKVPIVSTLNASGQITDTNGTTVGLTLYCTSGGDITPTGAVYVVEEYLSGALRRKPTRVAIPSSLGATVDMADLIPVDDTGLVWTVPDLTEEQARDLVGSTLVAGSGVAITVDDPGNTVTVAAEVTQAELDAEATTRAGADTALDTRLDTIEALGNLATQAELDAAVASEVARADGAYLALADTTAFGRSLVDDADVAAARATIVAPMGSTDTATTNLLVRGHADNAIGGGSYNSIVGGGQASPNHNEITGVESLRSIFGGYDNTIGTQIASSIIGSMHGTIAGTGGHNTIVGGSLHNILDGNYNTICGGTTGTIGTGSYSAIVGGATSTLYGSSAGMLGGESNTLGATGTTRGDYAAMIGGLSNDLGLTASARFSGLLGGRDHSVIAEYGGMVGGREGRVGLAGQQVWSNGQFAAVGDAQAWRLVVRKQTTDATANSELFLAGTSGRMILRDDSAWHFHVRLVARRTDANNESAAYDFRGCIDRNAGGGTVALVGAVTKTVIAEDTAAWDADVVADATNGSLKIQVTGEAAKTINWVACVDVVEVLG